MEDTSPDAQGFAQTLTDSTYLNVTLARDRRQLLDPLYKGHIRGFVVVPSYFSTFRMYKKDEQKAPIQVIADGGEPNTAAFVQNYVAQVWQKWLTQEKILRGIDPKPLINLEPRYWFNPSLESRHFLLPGSLAIIMTLIGTTLTALVIAREWERGTMEALMATPVRINEILIAKLISYFALAMVSMVCCVIGTTFLFGVPFRGSIIALFLTTSAFLLPALMIGLFISTTTKNQLAASQAAQIMGFLPAYILSGFIFEINSMPEIIQKISAIVPARYFIQSLLTLFLVGDVWSLFIKNIFYMVIVGLIVFGLTSRIIVKRLD